MTTASSTNDYLKLVRLPATLTATLAVLSNILAAHLIATEGWPDVPVLLPQLAAGALLSWAGLLLKDAFDLARGGPGAPAQALPAAMAANWSGWAVGAGLVVLGLAFAWFAGGGSFRVALILVVAIVAYYRSFQDSQLGPVFLGGFTFLAWMLGFAAVPDAASGKGLAIPAFFYATTLAILVRAQPRGADASVIKFAAFLLGLGTLIFVQFVVSGRLSEPLVLVPFALAVVAVGYALWHLRKDGSPAAVQRLVGWLTLGAIMLNALLLLGSGHWLWAPALLLLLLPLLPGLLSARRAAV